MTTEELLDEAFVPVVQFFKDNEDSPMTIKQHPQYHTEELVPYGTRLRLDWEVVNSELDKVKAVDVMPMFAKNDLLYLIEYGDVQITDDFLLSALDGSRKRGKEPSRIVIREANLIADPKPGKDTVEYTMFLNLYVDWD